MQALQTEKIESLRKVRRRMAEERRSCKTSSMDGWIRSLYHKSRQKGMRRKIYQHEKEPVDWMERRKAACKPVDGLV